MCTNNHGDGRVVLNDGTRFQFKITDHLGNTVVLFEDKDGDDVINSTATDPAIAEVLQRNLYYPFGLGLEGEWADETAPEMKYLYNSKEFVDDLGLNWSDYGLGYYDASMARWGQVAPLAEEFYSESPYEYSFNNPIRFTDPDGAAPEECCGALSYFMQGMADYFETSMRVGQKAKENVQEVAKSVENVASKVENVSDNAIIATGATTLASGGTISEVTVPTMAALAVVSETAAIVQVTALLVQGDLEGAFKKTVIEVTAGIFSSYAKKGIDGDKALTKKYPKSGSTADMLKPGIDALGTYLEGPIEEGLNKILPPPIENTGVIDNNISPIIEVVTPEGGQ